MQFQKDKLFTHNIYNQIDKYIPYEKLHLGLVTK